VDALHFLNRLTSLEGLLIGSALGDLPLSEIASWLSVPTSDLRQVLLHALLRILNAQCQAPPSDPDRPVSGSAE